MRWEPTGYGDPAYPVLPTLVVSERNLETLLAKLRRNRTAEGAAEPSRCAIAAPDGDVMIVAEQDAVHYDPARRAALGHAPFPGPVLAVDAKAAGIEP